MTDSSKMAILEVLAGEWEISGPPGIVDISDVAALVPLAPSDTMATVRELFAEGLVDMNALKTSLFLTPEGYDHVTARR